MTQNEQYRDRAIHFPTEEQFDSGLAVLEILEQQTQIVYFLTGDLTILAPHYVIEQLTQHLDEQNIVYSEPNVISISDLPPEEQARLRGHIQRENLS